MKNRYIVLSLSIVLALALAVPALGGPMNPIATISASVKSTATKALKTAKKAQKTAKSALTAAGSAQTTANAAQSAAGTAQTTANAAKKAAETAQGTANSALTAAKGAQTTANEAKSAAATAQATAEAKFGHTEMVSGEQSTVSTTLGLSLANCTPSGGTITGGGYSVSGGGNNEVVPIYTGPYGNAWLADLERIPGGTETWQVTAMAVCAKP